MKQISDIERQQIAKELQQAADEILECNADDEVCGILDKVDHANWVLENRTFGPEPERCCSCPALTTKVDKDHNAACGLHGGR